MTVRHPPTEDLKLTLGTHAAYSTTRDLRLREQASHVFLIPGGVAARANVRRA